MSHRSDAPAAAAVPSPPPLAAFEEGGRLLNDWTAYGRKGVIVAERHVAVSFRCYDCRENTGLCPLAGFPRPAAECQQAARWSLA